MTKKENRAQVATARQEEKLSCFTRGCKTHKKGHMIPLGEKVVCDYKGLTLWPNFSSELSWYTTY